MKFKVSDILHLKRRTLFAFFWAFLFLALIPISIEYKTKQLDYLSTRLSQFYPKEYWVHSHLVLFLLVSLAIVLIWASFHWLRVALKSFEAKKIALEVFLAFIILTVIPLQFADFIAPRAWEHPQATLNQEESNFLALASPLHKATFVEAKRFEFSNFEHSVWGGFPHGLNQDSPLVSALTLVFDLPVIDTDSFLSLIQKIFFVLLVFGGFGFYLFLRFCFNISPPVALLGGALYTVANPYASTVFTKHFPIFSGPFQLLPYSLICLWQGLKKRRAFWGLCTGAIVTLNLYILQPHPDAIIHAVAYLGGFLIIAAVARRISIWDVVQIALCMGIGLAAGSAYSLGALVEATRNHEALVLGHKGNIIFPYGWSWGIQGLFLKQLSGTFLFLPFVFLGFYFDYQRNHKWNAKSGIVLCLFASTFLLFAGGNQGPLEFVLKLLNIHASFIFNSRILSYYGLSALFCLCQGLNLYLEGQSANNKKFVRALSGVVVLATFLIYFQKWPVLSSYWVASLLTVLMLWGFNFLFERRSVLPLFPIIAFAAFSLAQSSLFTWGDLEAKQGSPYVELKTLISKARLFPEDKEASERLIRQKVEKYQRESGLSVLNPAKGIIEQSSSWVDSIDRYYQEKGRPQSLQDWARYYDLVPRYSLIMNNSRDINQDRFKDPYMAGIGEGLFTHNFSQEPDLRMMFVYPPLNALYGIPGHYFENLGQGYRIPSQYSVKEEVLNSPLTRQLFNIGGIDFYTFNSNFLETDLAKLELEMLPVPTVSPYAPRFNVVKDKRSYGMAYLAKEIHVIDGNLNRLGEWMPPFQNKSPDVLSGYKHTVDKLSRLLMDLKHKHGVYLETSNENPVAGVAGGSYATGVGNTMEILGISGNKAAFQVHCAQRPCQLVYNHAALSNWVAYEDQNHIPISRANFAFLSVSVGLGDHLVWFEYRPWGRIVGVYLTLVFFIVMGIQLLFYQRISLPNESVSDELLRPNEQLVPNPG